MNQRQASGSTVSATFGADFGFWVTFQPGSRVTFQLGSRVTFRQLGGLHLALSQGDISPGGRVTFHDHNHGGKVAAQAATWVTFRARSQPSVGVVAAKPFAFDLINGLPGQAGALNIDEE